MPTPIQLPEIPETERTALVERLLVLIEALAQENQREAETIQQLRDEIAVLKGEQGKPTFHPRPGSPNCSRPWRPRATPAARRMAATSRAKTHRRWQGCIAGTRSGGSRTR